MYDLFNQPPRKPPVLEVAPLKRTTNRESSENRQKMLERLKAGPLSTFDAERIVHRGQAVIGSLRERGHIIELTDINGVPSYRYIGHEPRVKVTQELQEAYYQTAHWRELARRRKELDGFRCQECKTAEALETHHWRYELFQEDLQHDLITFCRDCHQAVHRCAGGSGMHFPRSVSEEIAQRIREGR
jgi:hypothetical protein